MTSHIEVLNSEKQWIGVNRINPGKSTTFTNFNEGERDTLYSIACSPDDSSTRVHKRFPPVPKKLKGERNFEFPSYPWVLVAVLEEGQAFNFPVTSRGDGEKLQFRVIHRKEKRSYLKFV
jgi:hypothetical protein